MKVIKRSRPLLGTFVEIEIADVTQPERVLVDLAEMALGRIARVQALMNFSDPASELSRLNACGHLHSLSINAWTREVIAEAVRLGKVSEGVFDIVRAPLMEGWGTGPQVFVKPRDGGVVTYRDIVLHQDGRVSFKRPLHLDVNGLARGFAIDKAAEILSEAGIVSAVIRAGGDLRFIGKRPKVLPLKDPTNGKDLVAKLTAPAVATRAAFFANHCYHWRKVNHIAHPETGKPMRSNVSVTVFARNCVQAEALTKVVLLDEPEAWQSVLKRERASAVFVTAKGEVVPFLAAA